MTFLNYGIFVSMWRVAILTLFLISWPSLIKSDPNSFQRKFESALNPECPFKTCQEKGVNIFYLKAKSKDDVLHYLYSAGNFTETLSVIIIRSRDLNSTISIDYTQLFNNNKNNVINFKGKIDGSYGIIFTNFYEYNDTNDSVQISNDYTVFKRSFDKFLWNFNDPLSFTSKSMTDSNDKLLSYGNIQLNFTNSGNRTFSSSIPHLIFTGNNTMFDFVFNNLTSKFKNSRFAVEIALINNLPFTEMNLEVVRSIDDENSPGVFRINNFNGQNKNECWENSTYLQWKPVCYTSNVDRSLNKISVAYNSDLRIANKSNTDISTIESSLAFMFFQNNTFNGKMTLVNMTFGLTGDKFYDHYKYLIWTASFGQGIAPVDSVSITVILVIAFGLGLPFVLVVIGSIYLVVKKRLKRNTYVTIEDPINS